MAEVTITVHVPDGCDTPETARDIERAAQEWVTENLYDYRDRIDYNQ